jgi:hypothetical protein
MHLVLFVTRSLNMQKKQSHSIMKKLQFDDTEFRLNLSCSCGVIWL